MHKHTYTVGRSGDVETCSCGRFRFTAQGLAKHPPVAAQDATEAVESRTAPALAAFVARQNQEVR